MAFTGESLVDTVTNITSGRPAPILDHRPDAPPLFIELVDRATSLDPARRIVTIEELRAGLRSALEGVRARAATPVSGVIALPRASSPTTLRPSSSKLGTRLATVAEPPRKLNLWIIGTTALLAILAVLLVVFLQ